MASLQTAIWSQNGYEILVKYHCTNKNLVNSGDVTQCTLACGASINHKGLKTCKFWDYKANVCVDIRYCMSCNYLLILHIIRYYMVRHTSTAWRLQNKLQHSNMPRLRGILKSRKNLQDIGTSSFRVGRLLTPASFVWCMLKWIIWIIWVIWSMTDLWSFFPRENDKETLQTVSDRFQWFQASVPLFRLWSSGKMLGTPESTCRLDRLTLTREKKEKTHSRQPPTWRTRTAQMIKAMLTITSEKEGFC